MIQLLKVLTFCLFTLVIFNGQAQDVDSTKIKDLETQILKAVDDNNYELVKKLNQEKNIRLKADEAIKNGDLELAEKLKKQAETIASQRKEIAEETPSNNVVFTYDSKFEKVIKSGFCLEILTGFTTLVAKQEYYSTYNQKIEKEDFIRELPRFGLKTSGKIYFTKPNKFRFGTELGGSLLLGSADSLKLIQFSFLVGPTIIFTKNKKVAFTGSFLFGPSIGSMNEDDYTLISSDLGGVGAGLVIVPSVRVGFKKFFVGIDLPFGNYINTYYRINYSSGLVAAGFKF